MDLLEINAIKKIKKEFKNIIGNSIIYSLEYTVGLYNENNIFEWKITLIGPKDTSYSDGLFNLKMTFPKDYPQHPPEIQFLTPIYHLDVNPKKPKEPKNSGMECLGHVSFTVTNWWKPETPMEELFLKLYSIFYFASPSPYSFDLGEEYMNNRTLYEKKIKYFTNKYANPKNNSVDYTNKDWDLSIDEEQIKSLENDNKNNFIDIIFNINGKEKKINCNENALTKVAIEKLDIETDREDLLVIFKNRKININNTLKDNEITNNSIVIVIYDIMFN